jgi:hypothetical protein
MDEAKPDPKDKSKIKSPMSGVSPSSLGNIVYWVLNKVIPCNELPPPHFPMLGPYNVLEDLAKKFTHMTL